MAFSKMTGAQLEAASYQDLLRHDWEIAAEFRQLQEYRTIVASLKEKHVMKAHLRKTYDKLSEAEKAAMREELIKEFENG